MALGARPYVNLQVAYTAMCRHKYNWKIVEGDAKQPIQPPKLCNILKWL